MSYKIIDIEGIGPEYAAKFATMGITTTDDLYDRFKDESRRRLFVEKLGISETLVTKWFCMVDLMRVKGIGPQFSELLVNCDVRDTEHFMNMNPEELHRHVTEVNEAKNLTRTTPSVTELRNWMAAAREMMYASA